jgi:succinoglycan biosynthesis transport protein ExoP
LDTAQVRPFNDTARFLTSFFKRRKGQIFRSAAIIYGLVLVYVVMAPPGYYARSIVMIDARRNVLNDQRGGVMNYLMPSDDAVETEVEAIQSRENATEVVRRLKLDKADAFTKIGTKSVVRRLILSVGGAIRGKIAAAINAITGKVTVPAEIDPTADTPERRAADNLLTGLNVARVGQSYSIEVGFKWGNPVLAARIVNELIAVHSQREGDLRRQVRLNSTKELAGNLEVSRGKIKDIEARLAAARVKAGLLNLQSAPVGGDIATLKAQQASVSADAALASGRNRVALADAAVDANPSIQALRTQLSLAQADALSSTSRYGPQHPLAIEGRHKIEELQAAITKQANAIRSTALAGLGVEAAAQAKRSGVQNSALASAKADMSQTLAATGLVAQLEHDRDFEVARYDADFDRYKRILNTIDNVGDLTVSTVASTPSVPASPKTKLLMVLGVVIGLFGGLMIAVVSDGLAAWRSRDISEG